MDAASSVAWAGAANALCDLKRFDEALAAAHRAIELGPRSAGAWNAKGRIFFGLRQNEEALDAFERAANLDPGIGAYWGNAGAGRLSPFPMGGCSGGL